MNDVIMKNNNIDQFDESVIELDGVYDKVNMVYYVQPCPDNRGKYPSCVKNVNSDGDMIMSEKERNEWSEGRLPLFPKDHVFELKIGKKYDLNDPWDKAEWECVKNCPYIAPDRNARDANGNLLIDGAEPSYGKTAAQDRFTRNGVAELYIKHPGLDTHRKVSKIQKIVSAQNTILNDERGADGQRLIVRLLGRNMNNQPIADVLEYLLEIAQKNPEKILSLYTGSDTSLRLLLLDARDKHVIYVKNKVYIYADNIVLGTSDDQALSWMKDPKNNKILQLIRKDTYPEMYNDDTEKSK